MMSLTEHRPGPPSDWVTRWVPFWPAKSRVLDFASGAGRHTAPLADAGFEVIAADRDPVALGAIAARWPRVQTLQVDLENDVWPWPSPEFDVIVVTNYLWRPRFPDLINTVRPGGWLVYETFGHLQATIGRPRSPDFLLQPGELLARLAHWTIVAYESGWLEGPKRHIQRVAARRPDPSAPAEYSPLPGPSGSGTPSHQ